MIELTDYSGFLVFPGRRVRDIGCPGGCRTEWGSSWCISLLLSGICYLDEDHGPFRAWLADSVGARSGSSEAGFELGIIRVTFDSW